MTDPAKPRPTFVRYYVLAALCVVTVINYVQRNSIGSMVQTVVDGLGTDEKSIGLATAVFFVAYGLLQIPTGKLAEHWGPRRALTVLAVGWSLATAGMGLAVNAWGLVGLRGVMGALQAGIFPCATLIMVAWLPISQRAFASALLNSCMLIGGAAVSNMTGELLTPKGPLDWRTLLVVYAVPGLVWATWFAWWFRNSPEGHPAVNDAERELIAAGRPAAAPKVSPVAWGAILLSVPLWLICTQQAMRAGANRFTDQWLSHYLEKIPLQSVADKATRQATAKHLASLPQYAGVVGGLAGGLLSDWILRRTGNRRAARNGVAVVSLGLTILCYLPIFMFPDAPTKVVCFCAGSFIGSFAAPCAYALSMDVGGKNLPLVFGAMNMVGNFGAAAIVGFVPLLNDLTPSTWNASLVMFVAIHAIAIVCWLGLNPNRSIGERS